MYSWGVRHLDRRTQPPAGGDDRPPARVRFRALALARSRWWALVMRASIIVVIGGIALAPTLADALTYLALAAVPPLAALALAGLIRGAQPQWAIAVVPLFGLAWAARGSLVGEASAYALTALACVTLGSLLVALVPRRWIRAGVYAMAVVDVVFVATNLLQHPNSILEHAAPAAGLPQLQSVVLGSAAMGFGDLFIAATVGALLAAEGRRREGRSPSPRASASPSTFSSPSSLSCRQRFQSL
jgi:hypothetical protein